MEVMTTVLLVTLALHSQALVRQLGKTEVIKMEVDKTAHLCYSRAIPGLLQIRNKAGQRMTSGNIIA